MPHLPRKGRPPIPPRDSSQPRTLRELAGLLHISYDRARRLRQDGLSIRSNGAYDLHEALAKAYIATGQPDSARRHLDYVRAALEKADAREGTRRAEVAERLGRGR